MSTPVHNNPQSLVQNHGATASPKPDTQRSSHTSHNSEAASPRKNAAPEGPGNEHVQLRTRAPQPFSDRVLHNSTDARQAARALSTSLSTDGAAGMSAHSGASPELARLLNG